MVHKKSATESQLEKKLAMYALAGAAVLAPGAAHAGTITFVSGVNAIVNQPGTYTLTAGLTNILTLDAHLVGSNNQIDAEPNAGAGTHIMGFIDASDLAFNTIIDPSGGGWGTGSKSMTSYPTGPGSPTGAWPTDGSQGYLAFYFNTGGGSQAGWARVGTSSSATSSSFELFDYAYSDQGGATILAGDTGVSAVPEPSTMALLALGGAGLMALRRRRSTNA